MQWIKLFISMAAVFLAAYIGSVFTAPAIQTWYAALNKPPFNPPNWVFGPAWTILYLLMGTAAYLIWTKGFEKKEVKTALGLFFFQLILNSLWSILFFGMRSPLKGLVCIFVLWLAILFTIINFFRLSKLAGWLMVPYILWVTFAAVLNLSIYLLNR